MTKLDKEVVKNQAKMINNRFIGGWNIMIEGNDKVDVIAKGFINIPYNGKVYSTLDEPEWFIEQEDILHSYKEFYFKAYSKMCVENSCAIIKSS